MALALTLSAGSLQAADGLKLEIAAPQSIRPGQDWEAKFTVTNSSDDPFYFYKVTNWSEAEMHLVATRSDGATFSSGNAFWDYEGKYHCTFFKSLARSETLSFKMWVPGSVLNLTPGRYKVKWVYQPKITDYDRKCAVADVPVWEGHAESDAVELDVHE